MRLIRLKTVALAISLLAVGAFVSCTTAPMAYSQSNVSGDLAGTVTDPSGAAITGATVTAANTATGDVRVVKTTSTGGYRFQLLKPGPYTLSVAAAGFRDTTGTVNVQVGQVTTSNFQMSVGAASQTVQVVASGELLQTENADVSTTVSMEQTQNLPNPGNDITFYGQTAPGAVMNTQGGYGNFEVFGLPATSNNFTLNGGQEDDPFLNLNNSGPSNLLLGNNDIGEVDVVTNAYSSEYGTFSGAQVTSISRSGSNKFHGNASYWWNGTNLNGNNWLLQANQISSGQPTTRPGDVDNQWAAAVGGPVKRDKTFFFVDYEGIRFVTTNTAGIYIPSPSFQAATLNTLKTSTNPEVASEYNFYQKNIFGTYNGAPGASRAVATSDPQVYSFESASKLFLHEWFLAGRVDQNIGANDKAFFHIKIDKGVQPTYSDPFTTSFNAQSIQPDYEGQAGYTHTFGSNAVNQFLASGSYYGAVFTMTNPGAAAAILPESTDFIDGSFTNLNADGYAFPQGRNVTQYQVQDDFSLTKGRHTLKAGGFYKRDDVSDFDMQQFGTPLLLTEKGYYGTFQNGGALETYFDRFLLNPTAGNQPIGLYILGLYAEDDWKPAARFQLNAGVRIERDSEPGSTRHNFVRLGGNFFNTAKSHDTVNQPYSAFIGGNHQAAFVNYTPFFVEPRIGFTVSPDNATVIRGGFGLFTDVFPGVIADNLLGNYPFTINLSTIPDLAFSGLGGGNAAMTTNLLQPNLPDSAVSTAANEAAIYKNGFHQSYATLGASSPCPACIGPDAGMAPPNFTNALNNIHYPTVTEYSLELEHQFNPSTTFVLGYVGNSAIHEPVQNQNANGYAPGGAFQGLPSAPPAGGLGFVNEIGTNGVSNYNGMIVSLVHHSRIFMLQFNYTWSHSLDEVSNGGISPFSFANGAVNAQINPYNLHDNYGNSDYDARNVVNGDYLIDIPYWRGPRLLTAGWMVSGTFFFNDGYPFTLMDGAAAPYANGWGFSQNIPAAITPGTHLGHRCGIDRSNPFTNVCSAFRDPSNPAKANAGIVPATSFGTQERNQFVGPRYFDTDLGLMKSFPLGRLEGSNIKVGAQFFNILNHPNFGQPGADANATGFGLVGSMQNPPTSIFGSFLGGDASPRIIQLKGAITF
ncbi:MAG: carboxypeptidase regulatory-like domain-containing protein [Acidobacteriota bacterium]